MAICQKAFKQCVGMALCNKGRDDGIHSAIRISWCYVCLTSACPSSLPFLHTAKPAPCLNTFRHSHRSYTFLLKCLFAVCDFLGYNLISIIIPSQSSIAECTNPHPRNQAPSGLRFEYSTIARGRGH